MSGEANLSLRSAANARQAGGVVVQERACFADLCKGCVRKSSDGAANMVCGVRGVVGTSM